MKYTTLTLYSTQICKELFHIVTRNLGKEPIAHTYLINEKKNFLTTFIKLTYSLTYFTDFFLGKSYIEKEGK